MDEQTSRCSQTISKQFARKSVEATLSPFVESVDGAISSLLAKAVVVVAQHARNLVVFLSDISGACLIQKLNNQKKGQKNHAFFRP